MRRPSEGTHMGTRAGLGSMSEDLGPMLCLQLKRAEEALGSVTLMPGNKAL